MYRKYFLILPIVWLLTGTGMLFAQKASPQDLGKMWTFEHPPIERFAEEYGFEADEAWFNDVQKASLRLSNYCSASFVSPHGLIMTNFHCSMGTILRVEKDGENFEENGFYAPSHEEERKVEGMYVDQLINAIDISAERDALMKKDGISDKEAVKQLLEEYKGRKEFRGLEVQLVTYYSGAKHSVYVYKRFDDIRLVMVPEMVVGLYGGADDNFTYPRYNLDFAFWRAYDDDGNPANTEDHYFKFNINGPEEGEVVFTIGSPGRTERYKTADQLEYDRDYRIPMLHDFLQKRIELIEDELKESPSTRKKNSLIYLNNSVKVYGGFLDGLNDESFMNRKRDMDRILSSHDPANKEWEQISQGLESLEEHAWAYGTLGPSQFKGTTFNLISALGSYEHLMASDASEDELNTTLEKINQLASRAGDKKDRLYLLTTLNEVAANIPKGNALFDDLLNGKSIEQYVDFLFEKSKIFNEEDRAKLLAKQSEKQKITKDPLLEIASEFGKAYRQALNLNKKINPEIQEANKRIARVAFEVFGEKLSPDASSTPRISDGVVKSFDYNGTIAPVFTTFYGLYDRHYSHKGKEYWTLPERFNNPNPELLKTPINFISTNDIIGGNSGSPIVNRNKELVGLIFDGNMESLPGNYIYEDEFNRSVSVHAGGIVAVLQYVYDAKSLSMELLGRR